MNGGLYFRRNYLAVGIAAGPAAIPVFRCRFGYVDGSVRSLAERATRAKLLLVTSLAGFALIVPYDNVVDYDSAYEFVRHVLSMGTTFPINTPRTRAITNPFLWNAAYIVIITTGTVTALAFAEGTYDLLRNLRAPPSVSSPTRRTPSSAPHSLFCSGSPASR